MTTKWEYKVVSRYWRDERVEIEPLLNSLGGEGWEAVGIAIDDENASHLCILLKRAK